MDGTDFATYFSGKLNINDLISYAAGGGSNAVSIVFSHLPAGGSYEVVFGCNRGLTNTSYTDYVIANASGYANASSTAAIVDNSTATLPTDNSASGYVVRWTGIRPEGDGGTSFTVTVDGDEAWLYVPQVIILKYVPDALPITTFSQWANENGLTNAGADSDFDGVSNLMEYAMGLNPLTAQGAAVYAEDANVYGVDFLRLVFRRNCQATDLGTRVLISSDLETWTSSEADLSILNPDVDGDGNTELVEVYVEKGELEPIFVRLEVRQ